MRLRGAIANRAATCRKFRGEWPWTAELPALELAAAVTHLHQQTLARRGAHVLTLNVDIFAQLILHKIAAAEELIASYTLVLSDGMPIVLACKLAGLRPRTRVTGADLLMPLAHKSMASGLKVHFSGGPGDVAEQLALNLNAAHRTAASTHSTFELKRASSDASFDDAAVAIDKHQPDLIFLGYGFPKQDYLALRLRRRNPAATIIGCGAALEFAAGHTPRAPAVFQRVGLEWLHRAWHDPKRLLRRYLLTDLPAVPPLIISALCYRMGKRGGI